MKAFYYDRDNKTKVEQVSTVSMFTRCTEDKNEFVIAVGDIEVIPETRTELATLITGITKQFGQEEVLRALQIETRLSEDNLKLLGFNCLQHAINAVRKDGRELYGMSKEMGEQCITEETITTAQIIRAAKKRNFGV